ncbi:hypothetical protein [Lentzea flaviverrucosa]|uniref:Uncharacterized protein n=1 Tax=Lentzea flaviverrucosa TaxID=200379 RepID=A0A1H9XVA7_9PSEU|nr:hypothetical protein [Lentzea flaviverrucosa]RDI18728.1 hypothetical protein DFR72_11855 [Lentzea flaviverrucosa]SES50009.1 hypothetical protein SAMN05216195_118179 [Lentzea flaviverrucosa]
MTTPPATAARRPTARICFEAVPPTRFRRIAVAPPVGARVKRAEPGLSRRRSAESVRPQRRTAALPNRFPARILVTPGESARPDRIPAAPAACFLPASARPCLAAGQPATPVCSCREPAGSVRLRNLTAVLPARPHRFPARTLVTPGESARRGRAPIAPPARFLPASAHAGRAPIAPPARFLPTSAHADRAPTAPPARFLPTSARPRFTAAGHPTATPPTPSLDTREAA